jgi:Tfp pilus assembly protein PilF/uncharacterized protein (AIM24 family)
VNPSDSPKSTILSVEPTAGQSSAEQEVLGAQLRAARSMIASGRLAEAEAELALAEQRSPRDVRLLKMLALVRFKLGRLPESRQAYRQAAEVTPEDAAIKLNLGLIALKLEAFDEAARELEAATRLTPEDRRAWSYLGYAYARGGVPAQAATAFRRAGQHELAAEMERSATASTQEVEDAQVEWMVETTTTESGPVPRSPDGETPGPTAQSAEATPKPELRAAESSLVSTLARFTTARLLALPPASEPLSSAGQGVVRFVAGVETHVRESALLAAMGGSGLAHARRRMRGQLSTQKLARDGDRFLTVDGGGELLLVSPHEGHGLVALALDHDVFYVAEERAVAWGDEVVWESGSVPNDGIALLQFRGSGRVVIVGSEDELVALRVGEGDRFAIPTARVAGWLGRVVVQGQSPGGDEDGIRHLVCEGEGVLLLSKHGELH